MNSISELLGESPKKIWFVEITNVSVKFILPIIFILLFLIYNYIMYLNRKSKNINIVDVIPFTASRHNESERILKFILEYQNKYTSP